MNLDGDIPSIIIIFSNKKMIIQICEEKRQMRGEKRKMEGTRITIGINNF